MLSINNTKIVNKIKLCDNTFTRAHGLMFSKPINDIAYIFTFAKPMRIDLHMLFVFYQIDILWLDSDMTIQQIEVGARPWTFLIKGKQKSQYVVELPHGTVNQSKIKVGQKCAW